MPERVEALSRIKVRSVAAGENYSCAVTVAGELFTWGKGRAGKLGQCYTADQRVPRRVEALQGVWVVAVSAGAQHTIAVTHGGSVYGWGTAEGLGLPENADGSENADGFCV